MSASRSDADAACEAFYRLGAGLQLAEAQKMPLCDVADFCVFDSETSGLSRDACVVQLAIGFFAADGRVLGWYNKLWQLPEGVHMGSAARAVHGITHSRLSAEGVPARYELGRVHHVFRRMKARRRRIVAHNASFDCRLLAQSARSHGFQGWDLSVADTLCTMQRSCARCKLVSRKTGKPKRPSNAELHTILTGAPPRGALHDAQVDVQCTARSYVEGKRRGWW